MKGMVPPDPQKGVSQTQFAIVYVPKRSRKRFSANCVELVETAEAALAGADAGKKRFAAVVQGPSKSSEGQILYYLIEWLDAASD